jgi:hypothetical protein
MAPLRYPLKTATDVQILVPEEKKTYCEICQITCNSRNALAGHIGAKHRVKFEDYLIKYYNNNIRPVCPTCDEPTRYLRGEYSFKKYCVKHANESRKEWSLEKGFGNNDFDHNWRKGTTKETNEWVSKQALTICGKNNPAFLTEEQFNQKIAYIASNNITTHLSYSEYNGEDTTVNANCNICKRIIIKKFKNISDNPSCPSCNSGSSREEQEVYNYVISLCDDAVRGDRKIVGKELDIYSPSRKLAIEYNGLFWHTENKIGKKYHSSKTKLCEQKDIKLFHIFSDEWHDKKEIVKSMISSRLGVSQRKIHARK